MDVIEEIRIKRQKFLDGLDANSGDINLDIFEDFYPDKAHFVFELLQNAEDAQASNCEFKLNRNELRFIHDGKLQFSEKDINSITGIHNSTKTKASNMIGKFGVGFKSVFIYTVSPYIYSENYSFKIERLVKPIEVPSLTGLNGRTAFKFPFNSKEKSEEECYSDIRGGLNGLNILTILFLKHIKSISWEIGQNTGVLERIEHSDIHVEIRKRNSSGKTESQHFLRYSQPVEGLDAYDLSIAYELEKNKDLSIVKNKKQLSSAFKIVPSNNGKVSAFFLAEKETSGLRFHLNAPFVTLVDRSALKDVSDNFRLLRQISKLTAASLKSVRDEGLLTADFLGVLPNENDSIPEPYHCIREAVIKAFQDQPLTPCYGGGYQAAKYLLQAKASLKSLLNQNDLKFLLDKKSSELNWAIAANQRSSNTDRFLSSLNIFTWGFDEFISYIYRQWGIRIAQSKPNEFLKWLSSHDDLWHQHFYALLYKELEPKNELYKLQNLAIIRLEDKTYTSVSNVYLKKENAPGRSSYNYASTNIFLQSPKSSLEKDCNRLLSELGVKPVGERELIESLLDERYEEDSEEPSWDDHVEDLKRFIAYWKIHQEDSKLFRNHWIFYRADELWDKPSNEQMYLDIPFFPTGLSAYYGRLKGENTPVRISSDYSTCGIKMKDLVEFFIAIGVINELPIKQIQITDKNPEYDYLSRVPGERAGRWINQDYQIPSLELLLKNPTVELSKLIWNRMLQVDKTGKGLKACKQINETNGPRYAHSLLIHTLKDTEWVPQGDGNFVKPIDATNSKLPSGFPSDSGSMWLKAVEFACAKEKEAENHKLRSGLAKSLGFKDTDTMKRAQAFAELPEEQQRSILDRYSEAGSLELPKKTPKNLERRAQIVEEEAKNAPERETEKRQRSVSINRDKVKAESEEYLRANYTNVDGIMICQICQGELPFKLPKGEYYFEMHEIISKEHISKHHKENYITLCPNHGAMFKHINQSKDQLMGLIAKAEGVRAEIQLGETTSNIYFTEQHLADLKAVIRSHKADGATEIKESSELPTSVPEKEHEKQPIGPPNTAAVLGYDPSKGYNHYEMPNNSWTGPIRGQRSPSDPSPDYIDKR